MGTFPFDGAAESLDARCGLGVAEFVADAGGVRGPVLAQVSALLEVCGSAVVRENQELTIPSGGLCDLAAPVKLGEVLGIAGVPLPFSEVGVALSGIVLGALVAVRARAPLPLAMLLVGAFAIFHGYAHGRELPNAADPLAYGAGFVVATGLLHLCGILIGTLDRWPLGQQAVRACGAAVGCVGIYFLFAALRAA